MNDYLNKIKDGAQKAKDKGDKDTVNGYLSLLKNFDKVDWDGSMQLRKDAEKELKSLRRSEEDLIEQRKEFEKAKKDYEKKVKELNDQERLNALQNIISKQNAVRDSFTGMIDAISSVLNLMGSNDITYSFDLLNEQLSLTSQRMEQMQQSYNYLASQNPQTSAEAQAIQSAMAENSKQIISDMIELQNLKKQQRELLYTDLESNYQNLSSLSSSRDKAIERLTKRVGNKNDLFSSSFYSSGFDIPDLSQAKDNVEKQKKENEEILKLNKQFQKQNYDMQMKYLDLLAKEQAEDLQEAREDNDKTLKNAEKNMKRAEEDFKDMCDQFDEKYGRFIS